MESWKYLEAWVEEECADSIKRLDSVSIRDMNLNYITEERGYRKGLRKFVSYVRGLAEGR